MNTLSNRDAQVVWHPYSQPGRDKMVLPVLSAQGAYLHLEDGSKVLDAISSWWVNIHGHSHPKIAAAIAEQAAKLEHVIFSGFTHEPAVRLAEILLEATQSRGAPYRKVFYSDNGSTAVEVALKMAYQYFQNRKVQGRERFIALRGSYHGDTLGAMAVGDPEGFHSRFKRLLPAVDFIEPGDIVALESLLQKNPGQYAAFIFEPLIQGAEGMKTYSPVFLKSAMALCRDNEVLTIGDEVFTGFYRTGTRFAFEQLGMAPDLLCISKGITGGFLPLSATLATGQVFEAFVSSEMRDAFLHGHSYTANPIACAAALASWEILNSEECQKTIRTICETTKECVSQFEGHPKVKSVRTVGTIGAVEVHQKDTYYSVAKEKIIAAAVREGVLLRPLGNVLYSVPPYCVTRQEVQKIYKTLGDLIHEYF
ncbi:adenosylmethionine--8-amino-7-oxononanoate transaminase [bacterium]|nr:adenosylmethionine--8-amino-7-oxononanoate transaminase [bacterium]